MTHGNPSNYSSCLSRWTNGWNEAQYSPQGYPETNTPISTKPTDVASSFYGGGGGGGREGGGIFTLSITIVFANLIICIEYLVIWPDKHISLQIIQILLNHSHSFPLHIFFYGSQEMRATVQMLRLNHSLNYIGTMTLGSNSNPGCNVCSFSHVQNQRQHSIANILFNLWSKT